MQPVVPVHFGALLAQIKVHSACPLMQGDFSTDWPTARLPPIVRPMLVGASWSAWSGEASCLPLRCARHCTAWEGRRQQLSAHSWLKLAAFYLKRPPSHNVMRPLQLLSP